MILSLTRSLSLILLLGKFQSFQKSLCWRDVLSNSLPLKHRIKVCDYRLGRKGKTNSVRFTWTWKNIKKWVLSVRQYERSQRTLMFPSSLNTRLKCLKSTQLRLTVSISQCFTKTKLRNSIKNFKLREYLSQNTSKAMCKHFQSPISSIQNLRLTFTNQ